MYILSSTDRSVSFYQNSSVWLDRLDSRNWDRNPVDSNANPRFYHEETSASFGKFKWLCITIVFVYIYPLNGHRELDSPELIYIYCHPQTDCFVLSELFSVAWHAGRSKPGSKPVQLYVRPLGHQADHIGQADHVDQGNFKVF